MVAFCSVNRAPFRLVLLRCFFPFLDRACLEALRQAMPAMGMSMQQVEVFPHNLVVVGVLVAVPMNPQPLFLAPCPAQEEPVRTSGRWLRSGGSRDEPVEEEEGWEREAESGSDSQEMAVGWPNRAVSHEEATTRGVGEREKASAR